MPTGFYPIPAGATLPANGPQDVGGKAWNLMRMAGAGLPVPPAFVLPTEWCRGFRAGQADEAALRAVLHEGIRSLETTSGCSFGAGRHPLLVSVRSGAAISMPGMLETVLDVGLNALTLDGLLRQFGNPRLTWDCYRRFVQGYAEVVQALPPRAMDALLDEALRAAGLSDEHALDYRQLRELSQHMLARFAELADRPLPQDPFEQLLHSTVAVLRSWDAPKAAAYRRLNGLDDSAGTAVTVQQMVFGNAGGLSGSGVAFTRNPATGEPGLYLDFRFNGQGEDVVAGRQRLPDAERLRTRAPVIWDRLGDSAKALEALFKDAQDFEFTVQSGRLYLLQARSAKRTSWARLRIAVDMAQEGLISHAEARARLQGLDPATLVRTRFASHDQQPIARGQVASLGVASGIIALGSKPPGSPAPTILVRNETSTADIEAMAAAAGLLTAAGARTSHAAVVARQLGKVCIVGCAALSVDLERGTCRIGDREFKEGDWLSLDGDTGEIYAGQLPIVAQQPDREFKLLERWSRDVSVQPRQEPVT